MQPEHTVLYIALTLAFLFLVWFFDKSTRSLGATLVLWGILLVILSCGYGLINVPPMVVLTPGLMKVGFLLVLGGLASSLLASCPARPVDQGDRPCLNEALRGYFGGGSPDLFCRLPGGCPNRHRATVNTLLNLTSGLLNLTNEVFSLALRRRGGGAHGPRNRQDLGPRREISWSRGRASGKLATGNRIRLQLGLLGSFPHGQIFRNFRCW